MDLELPPDFKELLRLLNVHGVKYLLIGGYAVSYYGYVRSTNDIDIFVASDRENAENIVNALTDFGFAGDRLDPALFSEAKSLVVLGVEPMAVDIMNFVSGIVFEEAYAKRTIAKVEDINISLVSKNDLKKNKIASGRLKDLADVERLEKMDSTD